MVNGSSVGFELWGISKNDGFEKSESYCTLLLLTHIDTKLKQSFYLDYQVMIVLSKHRSALGFIKIVCQP